MSNVLIGIIGVILFIGLALAGALILGDDFRMSRNSSKAAAYITRTEQVANALTMYELKLGVRAPGTSNLNFLVPRFLKEVPPGYKTVIWGNLSAAYFPIPINEENRLICEEIQRQTRMISEDEPFFDEAGTINQVHRAHRTGCRRWNNDTDYVIWSGF